MPKYYPVITVIGAESREPNYFDSFEAIIYFDAEHHHAAGEVTVAPGRHDETGFAVRHVDDRILEHWRSFPDPSEQFSSQRLILDAVVAAGFKELALNVLSITPMTPSRIAGEAGTQTNRIGKALQSLARAGRIVEHVPADDGQPTFALPMPANESYVPIIIESPFAGNVQNNERYLRAAIRDCVARGEAPFASHRMYTAALDDGDPAERAAGVAAGFAWRSLAARTVVYHDLGISRGMKAGIAHATDQGHEIEYRSIPGFKP